MSQDNSIPTATTPTPKPKSVSHPYARGFDNTPEPEQSYLTRYDILQNPDYLDTVRAYMTAKKGTDYNAYPSERVVDDWLADQRYMEIGNEAALFDEYRFITRGNNDGDHTNKLLSAGSYDLYEQLGPAWETGETASAVADSLVGLVFSPTTYLGLGTIGLLKTAGGKGLQKAVQTAVREQVLKGGSQEAIKEAAEQALKRAATAQARRGVAAGALVEGAGQSASEWGRQLVRQTADPERPTDYFSLAFAGALGAVGGAMDAAASFANRGGFTSLYNSSPIRAKPPKPIRKKVFQSAASSVMSGIDRLANNTAWQQRVANGEAFIYSNEIIAPDVLREILGAGQGQTNIGSQLYRAGYNPNDFENATAAVSQFFLDMDDEVKEVLNPRIASLFEGTRIQTVDDFATALPRSLASTGEEFKVMSDVSKAWVSAMAGDVGVMASSVAGDKARKAAESPKFGSYILNAWRRGVVSHPGTSALNAQGSVTYAIGQTAADLLLAGGYLARSMGESTLSVGSQGVEAAEKAAALSRIVKYRMRTMFSAVENRQILEELMELSPEHFDRLKQVSAMGTETAERFNFEEIQGPLRGFINATEGYIDTAQTLTLVKAQDMYFKSWGVVDNLNRISELKYGVSLDEAIASGQFREMLSGDDFGEAVHRTLKQTFSADYTNRNIQFNNASQAMRWTAGAAEKLSNSPLGFMFPFGRFMANQLANAGEWTLSSVVTAGLNGGRVSPEEVAKNMTGLGMLYGAYEYMEEKDPSLAMYEVRLPNGSIVDMENNYPVAFMLAAGKAIQEVKNYGYISEDTYTALGKQIALGQAATDLSPVFSGIDRSVVDSVNTVLRGIDSQDASGLRPSMEGLGRTLGSVAAGFTRPLDVANDMMFLFGDDMVIPDRKQVHGFSEAFRMEGKRYTENLFEAYRRIFMGKGGMDQQEADAKREATRTGVSFEPNPFAQNYMGVRVQGPRTNAERVFALAGVPFWKANFRSEIPGFARQVNEEISAELDLLSRMLLDETHSAGGQYLQASENRRRQMLTGPNGYGGMLGQIRESILKRFENQNYQTTWGRSYGQHRLARTRESQNELYQISSEVLGLQGKDIREMTSSEVRALLAQIDRNRDLVRRRKAPD